MTLDQIFESFRRASVSSLQLQQEMLKQWTQQWASTPWNTANSSTDWMQNLQRRWMEFATESLNRHRESIDSTYKAFIQIVEQALHVSESKTPEEYRRTVEDLRQKVLDTYKDQSEAQIREFQKGAEKWFDMLPKA